MQAPEHHFENYRTAGICGDHMLLTSNIDDLLPTVRSGNIVRVLDLGVVDDSACEGML